MGKLKVTMNVQGGYMLRKIQEDLKFIFGLRYWKKITDNHQKTKAANLEKRGVSDFHGYYF